MHAARLHALGSTPVVDDIPPPRTGAGEVLLSVLACALNPVDLAIASGGFYGGHPPLPYVPGIEGVGRTPEGRLAYASGGGLGVARDGFLAEQVAVPGEALIELPPGTDPAVAVALGTAGLAGWLALRWRGRLSPGETVAVLGASGTAGLVACYAARLGGAGRVVAVGRDATRLDRTSRVADAVVVLGEDPAAQVAEACPDGVDLVWDALWGDPLVAVLPTVRPGGRVVHVGMAAGPVAAVPSALLRGRQLELLGYSNFAVPRTELVSAYLEMVDEVAAGRLDLPIERRPLARVDEAWTAAATGGKYVVEIQNGER